MSQGKILVAEQGGDYLLKFNGDLRVTLCGSLNRYLETIFASDEVGSVVVDLLDTEGLDSTTLGLLAKLALHCQRRYAIEPQLFCADPGLLRLLECMSLDELFAVHSKLPDSDQPLTELAAVDAPVDELRQQVLDAHRTLVELNPDKHGEFTDLIAALEREQAEAN